jgi:hypothetical protein
MLPKMTNVETVERTISQLTDKRDRVVARSTEIAAERQELGFAVHADNDKAARAELDKLNAEAATLAGEIQSIDGALVEAQKRLQQAQQAASREAAKANAAEIRKLLIAFSAAAQDMDEALADFATASHELRDVVNNLHGLGCQFPNHSQVESLGTRCVLTAIGQSIFNRAVETLAPNQRRAFVPTVAEWIASGERNQVAPLLGEQTNKEKADAA